MNRRFGSAWGLPALLLSPWNIRSNRGLEQNPKNHCFGVFQVGVAVCLWSEYVTITNFHVGKKKFAVPAKISAELQNLSFHLKTWANSSEQWKIYKIATTYLSSNPDSGVRKNVHHQTKVISFH